MATGDPTGGEVAIERGCILAFRVFDVCDEIALDAAERLLEDARGRRRGTLSRGGAQVTLASPPLDIELGPRTVDLASQAGIVAELSMRFFDYGAVSVEFEVAIPPGTRLSDLLPLCDDIYESTELEELARHEIDQLLPRLRSATQGAHGFHGVETYTVIFAEAVSGATPDELARSPLLAKLLVGESTATALSDDARNDVLQHRHSYLENDLAIIDWNSAFVLEPSGSRDVPELLEFATSQLLELRYYDTVLDAELGRIYDEYASARRDWRSFLRNPYARLTREVVRRFIELTEFTERVDNALKLVGDFYLARVYQSALQRFRIPTWRASIDAKQSLVARSYDLLKGEADTRRSTILEVVVIVLIAVEIVTAVRGR